MVNHWKAGDLITLHQQLGIAQRLLWRQRDRLIDHTAFKTLNAADFAGLRRHIQVAVNNADTARLRHGNRHTAFGYGIHRRRQKRDIHPDALGHKGGRIRLGWQHRACSRHQQNVIKSERLANLHESLHRVQVGVFV